jgi:hypothetical protein
MGKILQIPDSLTEDGTRRDAQIENYLAFLETQPHLLERQIHNFAPQMNILAVLRTPEYLGSGKYDMIANFYYCKNIVTNDGDIYYAKVGAGETPSANEDFSGGRMELNNPASADTLLKTDDYSDVLTPITNSRKVFDGSYPRTADPDGDNTGAGVDVVSYLTSWSTSDFNDGGTTVKGGMIHDNVAPSANSQILTHYSFGTPFNKTASDTLKVFVNHEMLGV